MPSQQMYYHEAAPAADLSRLVLSFWEFSVSPGAPSPIFHDIFPDGCISVFYLRNLRRGLHMAGISGLYLSTTTKPVEAGDTVWGMRISPAACRAVLRSDPQSLTGRSVVGTGEFEHLTLGLAQSLSKAASFRDAIGIFEARLQMLAGVIENVDAIVHDAVRRVDESRGEIRVDELAAMSGLSIRQFQRRFKASSGLLPKQYCRARRIRSTAVDIVESNRASWAARAAEHGFSDQAHMTHEFIALTKRSPNAFAKKYGTIEHGKLVK